MDSHDRLVQYVFRNPEVDLPLEVISLERLRRRLGPSARDALHRGDFHQLFIVGGEAVSATVDFNEHLCPDGAVLHVRPGQVVRLPHGNDDRKTTAVLFTSVFPQQLSLLADLLGPYGAALHSIPPDFRPAFLRSVDDLDGVYQQAMAGGPVDAATRSLLRQVLGVVLLRVVPHLLDGFAGQRGSAIQVTRRFRSELERAFGDTKSARVYAQRLGYSTRTLDRACVATTGRTAKRLIDDRVVLEAKRLLAHTPIPVGAIATGLGFSEQSNFSKYFQRLAGVSPDSFRQTNS